MRTHKRIIVFLFGTIKQSAIHIEYNELFQTFVGKTETVTGSTLASLIEFLNKFICKTALTIDIKIIIVA